MASRHRLDDAAIWRVIGRLEARESQVACSCDLEVSINELLKQFTQTDKDYKRSTTPTQDPYSRLLAARETQLHISQSV
ncbi:hypothetical protein TNCV_700101 [Trichonephila clavipes]|nr:hypothetical protein TNCV_700101 [Trichonephila clavipes]